MKTCSNQPLAIRELFEETKGSVTRTNTNTIKIPNEYKKGHCMYNLIDNWNKCKNGRKLLVFKKHDKRGYSGRD